MTQQLTEINILPVFPRDGSVSDEIHVHSIEAEVLALEAGINSGGLSETKTGLQQLQMLSGMVGRDGKLQAMISAAIAKAQRHIEELESEGNRRSAVDRDGKFESSVYVHMSVEARRFYDNINVDTSYDIAQIGEDGEIINHAAKKVDGRTLRHRMSLIKFHSLATEHKKQVLHESYGVEEAKGEGTPKDKALLEKKKKELYALHDAINDMEAYKALMILRRYPPDVAVQKIKENHEIIVQMHHQIDEVIHKYDELISDIENPMAMARLKAAKLKMKEMIERDVIGYVLLEKTTIPPMISDGIGAAGVTHATTGVGFAAAPHVFRPFAH